MNSRHLRQSSIDPTTALKGLFGDWREILIKVVIVGDLLISLIDPCLQAPDKISGTVVSGEMVTGVALQLLKPSSIRVE